MGDPRQLHWANLVPGYYYAETVGGTEVRIYDVGVKDCSEYPQTIPNETDRFRWKATNVGRRVRNVLGTASSIDQAKALAREAAFFVIERSPRVRGGAQHSETVTTTTIDTNGRAQHVFSSVCAERGAPALIDEDACMERKHD